MNKLIKLNDTFSISRDLHYWTVHRKLEGEDKDGNPKVRIKKSYFPNMLMCLGYIQDIECGDCGTIEEILSLLKDQKWKIV